MSEKAPEIKVFRVTDCDWVAATTPEEARQCWLKLVGESEKDQLDEFGAPAELPPPEMERLRFYDCEKDTKCSFRAELDRRIAAGTVFPEFFASTEY
jgi:hypothetical protein